MLNALQLLAIGLFAFACLLLLYVRTATPSVPLVRQGGPLSPQRSSSVDSYGSKIGFNATTYRPFAFQRKRTVQIEPMQWRRNRKKMTELTTITSEKQAADAASDGTEPRASSEASSEAIEEPIFHSTLNWLAEKWSPAHGSKSVDASPGPESGPATKTVRSEVTAADIVAARRRRRQRRRARELCLELQRRHNVVPRVSWGTLPDSQRESWQVLTCNEQIEGAAVALSSQEDTVVAGGSDSLVATSAVDRDRRRQERAPPTAATASVGAGVGPVADSNGGDPQLAPRADVPGECAQMAQRYSVIVGASWGTMPEARRIAWTQLKCDRALASAPGLQTAPARTLVAAAWAASGQGQRLTRGGDVALGQERRWQPARANAAQECRLLMRTHNVRPGSDWGSLPLQGQQRWTRLGCDGMV